MTECACIQCVYIVYKYDVKSYNNRERERERKFSVCLYGFETSCYIVGNPVTLQNGCRLVEN